MFQLSTKQFWLKQGERELYFPVNPESITISSESGDETFKLEKLGKTTIPQPADLYTFSFSSEFPAKYFVGCQYKDLPDPRLAFIKVLQMQMLGVSRFIITEFCNLEVTIDKFQAKEVGGDVGTFYFDIELKEYRRPIVKKVEQASPVANKTVTVVSSPQRPPAKPKPSGYIVKAGDCLRSIAKSQLGNGNKWRQIAQLNNIKPKYLIYPGQSLRLK